ncbi:MAG: ABC-F family ATP-binding cassette domain-containing protein [Pseudomonadota bacterium]
MARAATTPRLTLEDVHLTFGGDPLFTGVGLAIMPQDRIALVGRNGTGKSTLMKIIADVLEPDKGNRHRDPGVTVLYLPQEPDLSGYRTVTDYLTAPFAPLSEPLALHEMEPLMEALDVDGSHIIDELSGGEARKVALVRALAAQADILLLDEPTNHLDIAAIDWLEGKLKHYRGALVLISHDRRFLETVTDKTIWLDRGVARLREQGFDGFEAWRDQILEEEEVELHKLGRKIVAEEHWVRYGVTARRKRNVRRMRELQGLRDRLANARRPDGTINFAVNTSGTSGKTVIEAENIAISFDGRAIVRNFSVRITKGDKIGLVGPNGAGKTTLLNLLTGQLSPQAGTVKIGTAVDLVTLDQKRASLTPGLRVADAITDGRGDFVTIGDTKKHVATYLRDFLFTAEQWRAPVEALSGGERGRLALAAALAKRSNLLVLDEPTNDLDLETLDLLQDLLTDYQGTLLLVSHDRSFLDRTVTSTIAPSVPQEPGGWTRYAGGYSDLISQVGAGAFSWRKANRQMGAPSFQNADGEGISIDAAKPPSRAARQKLSFKEKHALETLPARMTQLETEIADCQTTLAKPDLFTREPGLFRQTTERLEKAEAALAQAEETWLTLEMKREEIEG